MGLLEMGGALLTASYPGLWNYRNGGPANKQTWCMMCALSLSLFLYYFVCIIFNIYIYYTRIYIYTHIIHALIYSNSKSLYTSIFEQGDTLWKGPLFKLPGVFATDYKVRLVNILNTVDGRNPAFTTWYGKSHITFRVLYIQCGYPDFFHQQYHLMFEKVFCSFVHNVIEVH